MRRLTVLVLLLPLACASQRAPKAHPTPARQLTETATPATSGAAATVHAALEVPAAAPERFGTDTPRTTVGGNTFIAPRDWTISVRGGVTILSAPEGDSEVALVDLEAADADAALARAWAAYDPNMKRPLLVAHEFPDKDGWSKARVYEYRTSPNERRVVAASARFANGQWTVALEDLNEAVAAKRSAQLGLLFGKLLPKGQARESFAGRAARPLDRARIQALSDFITSAQRALGVPGVSLGLVQGGKVVFAGGFGQRALGKAARVDADTRYMIASNTKAMTTLMLAKLVDEHKLTWDTPATSLLPSFKLGDSETTSRVLVKHLICACTGLPRQDMEWLFQFGGLTCERALATLATMQPTSRFGELFQYSNPLAAAAGFIGGHAAFPDLELGAAYDRAMRTRVFTPLGMKVTTFDFREGQSGNAAAAHAIDIDGKPADAGMEVNYAVIPLRPAGGAWSTVRDVLKYVQMELAEGVLPGGKRYISKEALLARRAPQVAINADATYGMGLMVDRKYDVTVVHHGGDMIGYHSDMMWLPEHGVGAVILTNGDPGWLIRTLFRRKLLEVLFDGRPEADADLAAEAKTFFAELAAERKLLTVPAEAARAEKLASTYANPALGEIGVDRAGGKTVFEFGEWKSEVATRHNPDGTTSFVTTRPGLSGFEFVVGNGAARTLTLRDAQHEYVFEEKAPAHADRATPGDPDRGQ